MMYADENTGAGHSGLMIGARLGMLGVSTLIIGKSEWIGDSWRKRYYRLVLHDPCWMNARPYFAYPTNWPIYASKDKMADFLEVRWLTMWYGKDSMLIPLIVLCECVRVECLESDGGRSLNMGQEREEVDCSTRTNRRRN